MTELDPSLAALFAAARAATPRERDVDAVLRRGERRRLPLRARLSRSSAVALAVLAATGVGTIGAFAAGVLPLGHERPAFPPPVQRVALPAPASLRAHLGVLRAPARPVDRDADARRAAALPRSGPVYADGVRYVGLTPLGERLYLVPLHDMTFQYDPHAPVDAGPADGVALAVVGRFGGIGTIQARDLVSILTPGRGPMSVESPVVGPAADALRAAADVPASLKGGSWITDVVPDGVATVRIAWKRDRTTLDLSVHDNVAFAHSGRELGDTDVTWLDAHGRAIPVVATRQSRLKP